jgi:hypothetical protein
VAEQKMEQRMRSEITALLIAGVTVMGLGVVPALAKGGPMGMGGPMGGPGMMFSFDDIDADKDGAVTQAEVDAFKAAQFAKIDANSDGKVTAEELVAFHETQEAARKTEMAGKMIERMDSDADGALTAEELAAMPQPKTLFEMLDADGDGSVTKAEAEAARDHMGKRGERHERGGWMKGMMGGDN